MEKVRTAHEELVGSCERRERLERAARVRLQADCRRLHDLNRALKQQVASLQHTYDVDMNEKTGRDMGRSSSETFCATIN